MDFRHILYQPGKVARIILNRPRVHNAQSYLMLEELDGALKEAAQDRRCGAIVLSGAGPSFSAGHDLGTDEDVAYRKEKGYALRSEDGLTAWFEDMRKVYVDFCLAWRNLPKPTIAMVHGYCIFGGWMVAASMDIIFAADDALFLPGFVEYFSVPYDIGPRRAKEVLFEHRFLTAEEARAYGFVNRVFDPEDLEKETLAYAERVADNYLEVPYWVRLCKFSINHMEETWGLNAEVETSFNHFCLMAATREGTSAPPSRGGFARTNLARKHFDLSRPWLERAGLWGRK